MSALLCFAGPGEPFTSAAGVLGVMAIWRCFYTACAPHPGWVTDCGAATCSKSEASAFRHTVFETFGDYCAALGCRCGHLELQDGKRLAC